MRPPVVDPAGRLARVAGFATHPNWCFALAPRHWLLSAAVSVASRHHLLPLRVTSTDRQRPPESGPDAERSQKRGGGPVAASRSALTPHAGKPARGTTI